MSDLSPLHVEAELIAGVDPVTADQARWLTARIKAYVGQAWRLLAVAYKRQAHKALGFETWEQYVGDEFGISRSYAYRLLDRAFVIGEIEAAAGMVDEVGGDVSPIGNIVTEFAAREVKPVLPEVVETIKAELAEHPEADPVEVVAEVVAEVRAELKNAGGSNPAEEGGAPDADASAADPPAPSHADASAEFERRDEEANPGANLCRNFGRAAVKINGLLAFEPKAVAEVADKDMRRVMQGLSTDLRQYAERIDHALRLTSTLRSAG